MSNHEVWNELGNLYLMNGAYEPAINSYLRAIQLDDKFGRSFSNLALAFVHTGKYTEAIKLYRHSIELMPDAKDKAITWNRLGILYRQVKDYKNALDAYQQADILDSQPNDARNGLSIEANLPLTVSKPPIDLNAVLGEGGPADEARKLNASEKFNAIMKSTGTKAEPPWVADDLIPLDPEKILQEMENKKPNIEILVSKQTEWKLAYMENTDISEKSVIVEENLNIQNEAEIIEAETECVQNEDKVESGQKAELFNSTIVVLAKTEVAQYSQTEATLPELTPEELSSIEFDIAKYKITTRNDPRNVSAWEMLGDAYKSAGMYKDAIQAFKTAISLNPTKPSYYYRLGLTYSAERRESEAILTFEKVLELNPNHALAHASLGSHYQKMGMDDLAQTHIKQALETNFEKENKYNQACLEAICGNADRAIELLKIALETKQTYINWAMNDPDLDSLHEDYRFKALLSAHSTSL